MLLTQKGVECFLPLKKTLVQRSDRKKWVQLPLLPSYVFVKVTEKERFNVLNTPGAVGYVSFEGRAVAIPEDQIRNLQYLDLNNHHEIEVHYGSFAKGDLVEVVIGPLKGITGEVMQIRGSQRLVIRFESLGYCIHVEAPLYSVKEKADIAV